MGSTWVDGSPDWGSIGTNMMSAFAGAPAKAAQQTHLIETIKDQRIKRARDEEQYQLGKSLADSIEARTPAAYVAPRAYTAADISNPAVLDAPLAVTDKVSGPYGGADVANGMFTDPRALALAEARRKTAILGEKATLMKDPSVWAAQGAYAENAAGGMPADMATRARLTFDTTGKYPTREEMKTPNAQNFAVVKADGTGTGQGFSSLDGGKTAIDGTPITLGPGERLMETGPAALKPPDPMESEATARQRLAVLAKEIGPGGVATPDQQAQVAQLIEVAYKKTRVVEKAGDREIVKEVRQTPVPPWVVAMMQPPAPPPAAPLPPPTTIASQAITASDISTPARLDAPLPPPAPEPPPPPAPLPPVDPNEARIIEKLPGSAIELRKEIQQAPAFKTYNGAISDYNNVVRAATEGEPNNTTDLNIIYSIAKIFDPQSAVKEGELKLPNATGSFEQQLSSLYSRLFTDKGMMSAETRAHLVSEATRRVKEYKESVNVTNTQYKNLAQRAGVDPEEVIMDVPPMVPYNPADALRAGSAAAAGTPRPPSRPNY